jgi:hypothetical protein
MRSLLKTRLFLMLLAAVLVAGAVLWSPVPAQAYGECYFVQDNWCYYDTGGWCHFSCGETCQGDTSGQIYWCEYQGEVCCF